MKVVSKTALAAYLGARMASVNELREWRQKRLFRMRRHMLEDRVRCALRHEPRTQVSEAAEEDRNSPLPDAQKQNALDRTEGVL